MKNKIKFAVPAVLALSMAMAPMTALAEEFVPGPGNRYDDATIARMKDNVLEYDEISLLIEEYNTTYKNLKDTYDKNKNSAKDAVRLKEQIHDGSGSLLEASQEMSNMAGMFKDSLGYQTMVTPGSYAQMLYSSELLGQQAEQMLLSVDTVPEISPEMLKLQVVDTGRAGLISGAQSAMIGYEQLLLQKESLESTIELLEAVYQSAQTQASVSMATQNDVLSARQNLESAQAGMITIDANLVKIRQTLCTMMGWSYDAVPEIMPVPGADMSRLDAMNLEADIQTAIANNFTVRYNELDYEKKDNGSVEQKNLERLIANQKSSVASSLTTLYNEVLQKKNEFETAVSALELEKTKMDAAERKYALGTIGRLEYLQQQNAWKAKAIGKGTADLSLFQAMEAYDWVVKGNLRVPTA